LGCRARAKTKSLQSPRKVGAAIDPRNPSVLPVFLFPLSSAQDASDRGRVDEVTEKSGRPKDLRPFAPSCDFFA